VTHRLDLLNKASRSRLWESGTKTMENLVAEIRKLRREVKELNKRNEKLTDDFAVIVKERDIYKLKWEDALRTQTIFDMFQGKKN
jgi:cell division protein FtsB